MKKRFTQIARTTSLRLVVCLTALALLISGAEAASRLFSAYQLEDKSEQIKLSQAEISVSPMEAAENSKGMDPTGQPNGEPVGYWQTLPILPGSASGRGRLFDAPPTLFGSLKTGQPRFTHLSATSCQVSSCLGRLFTLVGAKPSGTS